MKQLLILLITSFSAVLYAQPDQSILLNGAWRFQSDAEDKGVSEKWHNTLFDQTVRLPGSMAENEKGDRPSLTTPWMGSIWDSSWYFNPAMAQYRQPGNMKFPFWLTPERYYLGPAWYQKEVFIPKTWSGKHIKLTLERPHWQTTVWVDSFEAGHQNSLSCPHRFDLSPWMTEGKHRITVRVDNRITDVDPGNNSHSLTDHTQGNWNGIVGALKLEASPLVWIDDIYIIPDIEKRAVRVRISLKTISQLQAGTVKANVMENVELKNRKNTQNLIANGNLLFSTNKDTTVEMTIVLGNRAKLWDEFSPAVYTLKTELTAKSGGQQTRETAFGLRDFKAKGSRFEINGRQVFLRGTVECCVFPKTGYPPTDEVSWSRIFTICKNYGLNHMRFHSYCPPQAAFDAADRAGFYLQVEGPSWPNYSTAMGMGRSIDKYIYEETERIVKEYGNHPSFCMMAACNEPNKAADYVTFLNTYIDYWKNRDPRRVYTGASIGGSWEMIPHSEFQVRAKTRGLTWKSLPETQFDYADRIENKNVPYLTHEMGQWCAFPNFGEIAKYTGVYSAGNFEIFRDILAQHHLGSEAQNFLLASGKLQALCYKMEIEATLRTPGFAGFQLLGLNDFPGQGTALTGVLDVFWDNKGYINARQFSQFCNRTVPLARMAKFVYKNNESFKASAEVAHFGTKPIEKTTPKWRIIDAQKAISDSGHFSTTTIPTGNCFSLGAISVPLTSIKNAGQFRLEITVDTFTNGWDFGVYPAVLPKADTSGIYTCTRPDAKATEILKNGGKVLLLAAGNIENGKDVVQYFTPVFWNTSWFKMRPPHTTGIWVNTLHPVFKTFPSDYYSNLQWFELLQKQQVMNIDSFPADFRPIVRSIDTWFLSRRLSILFEAKVFNGKLMVCSADLTSQPDSRIVARQLLWSLQNYMSSPAFDPKQTLPWTSVTELFEKKERKGWDSFTREVPDELKKAK
jgi:hypothetical protein